jgi:hypothetical protein
MREDQRKSGQTEDDLPPIPLEGAIIDGDEVVGTGGENDTARKPELKSQNQRQE